MSRCEGRGLRVEGGGWRVEGSEGKGGRRADADQDMARRRAGVLRLGEYTSQSETLQVEQ